MKKLIFAYIISAVLAIPIVAFAVPVTVDRPGSTYIQPGITTDFMQAAYFKGSSATASSTFAALRNGEVALFHSNGSWSFYAATTSSDIGRGTALLSAIGMATSGDTMFLASSTYDLGTLRVDLSLNGTGCMSLRGVGKYSTIIKSDNDGGASIAPIVQTCEGSETRDLSIIGTSTLDYTQYPWGSVNGSFRNSSIENVYIRSTTDGIYYVTSVPSYLTIRNVTIDVNVDALTTSNAGGVINVYNSIFSANGLNHYTGNHGIIHGAGIMNVFNTFAQATGATGNNYAFSATEGPFTPTILNIYGGIASSSCTSSCTAAYDVGVQSGPGTPDINVTPNTLYSTASTTGTITQVGAFIQAITGSISGAIIGLGCDSTDTTSPITLSSTTAFVTTPQSYPGDGLNWFSYSLNSTTIRTKICSDVTVTPNASTYVVKIIR